MAPPLRTATRPATTVPPPRPEVRSHPHHAFRCELLRAHPDFDDWLAGTFLRLYAHEDFAAAAATARVPFDFDTGDGRRAPLLDVEEHPREAVATLPAAAAFLAGATGAGHAVLVHAEKSHVPGTDEYGRARAVGQVMYVRGPAPGTLQAHAADAADGYARADTTPAEAALACVEAREDTGHRHPVQLLRPRPGGAARRFTPAALHLALTRALDGQPACGTGGFAGEDGGPAPRITAGLAASRTLRAQAARMLHGELPLDVRPFQVYLEHKQRLAAALDLLAARSAAGLGRAVAAFAPSAAALRRTAELRGQAAELRDGMAGRGAARQDVRGWLEQARTVLERERLLHHVLCRETAPNRRVTVPVAGPRPGPRAAAPVGGSDGAGGPDGPGGADGAGRGSH
ncbi:hypothetical protein [Kitasatospora sp. NPDC057198]|uniref:hypothetical protein n=1 Tax=Kitasatospora sp. NPDC057198 TaxID=3346046 RepID=UPI00363C9C3F